MRELTLYMILLGCRPEGGNTEQPTFIIIDGNSIH